MLCVAADTCSVLPYIDVSITFTVMFV